MAANSDPSIADIVRFIRAFIVELMEKDAVDLRPDRPRIRGPLTPTARNILRALIFHFENIISGLCMPSLAVIAQAAGCSQTSVKDLLGALYRTEYLSRKHGKQKRVQTTKGWRVVRSSNRYRILCPHRHIAALRRALLKAFGGKGGPLVQKLLARYTPPTEEAKATAEIVETLAADLRPGAARTTPTPEPEPQKPPQTGEPVEIGGVRVEDQKLGSVLAGLWAALEKREQHEF